MNETKYQMPSAQLFDKSSAGSPVSKEELKNTTDRIIHVLKGYDIEVISCRAIPGQAISKYNLELVDQEALNSLFESMDTISQSISPRVHVTVVPNTHTVCMEVPNRSFWGVPIGDIFESDEFMNSNYELPIVLGKRLSNNKVFDLAEMSHLMVAGGNFSERMSLVNAIISSLLMKKRPDELKLVLIDPRMVELSDYECIERHYLAKLPGERCPVVDSAITAMRTLNALTKEMERRYHILRENSVNNVKLYNEMLQKGRFGQETNLTPLPYIVVVIQDYSDLVMQLGQAVEMSLTTLAKMARAVGIHIILNIARPVNHVIFGIVNTISPSIISFKASSPIESERILGIEGAELLSGHGDMLVSLHDHPQHILEAWVTEEEVRRLTHHISEQPLESDVYLLPDADEDLVKREISLHTAVDTMTYEVARYIVLQQRAVVSEIQRKFLMGYNRACRIMDCLEMAKVVNGSSPRDVLVKDLNELEPILKTLVSFPVCECKSQSNADLPKKKQTVFELTGICCDEKAKDNRFCSKRVLGLYSSLAFAEGKMRKESQREFYDETHYWAFIIKEYPIDAEHHGFESYRTYNAHGVINDECLLNEFGTDTFHGREANKVRFHKGDIVWCLRHNIITLEIVSKVPPSPQWVKEKKERFKDSSVPFALDVTDDSYLIYSIGEGDTHSHPFSPNLFPVTEKLDEELIRQLRDKLKEMDELYK